MTDKNLWVVQTRHRNPNDFYVKTDGAEGYTTYWVANTSSAETAEQLTLSTAEDLVLGEAQVVSCQKLTAGDSTSDQVINSRIQETASKLSEENEIQLSVWSSDLGGVW